MSKKLEDSGGQPVYNISAVNSGLGISTTSIIFDFMSESVQLKVSIEYSLIEDRPTNDEHHGGVTDGTD